jgi:hypothetical protein
MLCSRILSRMHCFVGSLSPLESSTRLCFVSDEDSTPALPPGTCCSGDTPKNGHDHDKKLAKNCCDQLIHWTRTHAYINTSMSILPSLFHTHMPGQLSINPRRAQASLRVVVVGGGLAGIASAFTLQRAGHNVTVLERSDGKARVSSTACDEPTVLLTRRHRVSVDFGVYKSRKVIAC